MYGLRTAPRDWQLHFAQVRKNLGFNHLQSDANVYINHIEKVIIYAYVDDLLMIGASVALDEMLKLIETHFLIKFTGELIATVAAVTCLFGALFVAREIDRDFSPDSRRTTFDFELLGSCRVAMPARLRF